MLEHQPQPAAGDAGKNNTAAGGGGGDAGGGARNSKPMSMPERARRARVPQPEPGLNCPRCDSTNTKFCYFNNYSLTQPRHYCRACRRYWTHGGVLRTVPVGSGYRRRHTKRSANPRATSADRAAMTRTSTTPSIAACTTGTTTLPSGLQYLPMFSSTPLFADFFDPESLGLHFPARLRLADPGVADDGGHHHHHQGNLNGMEQCVAAQMNNFSFLQTIDHQMFEPPVAAMPTTMVAMHDMFHLELPSGGNGEEDGGHHQFHHHAMLAAKGDHQQQQDCPSTRGMYGDIVNAGGGYNFYSSTSHAAGN